MGDVKIFYPEFVPNQILTNTQLNRLREHLERQELHTRLRLAGTGIVCGFNWAVVTSPNPAIELSEGYGISSDGELIEQCGTAVYTHRRAYVDPDRDETGAPRYPQWRKATQIIELIDPATMGGTDLPEDAVPLTAADITLNRVLVLYLEHEPVDLNSCLVTSCDNKGLNINVRVRALLVKKSDLSTAPGCAAPPVLERIPRMHAISDPQKITNAEELTEAFGIIVTRFPRTLGKKIWSLFDSHAAFLDVDKFTDADLDALAGKLLGDGPAQYRYDALVDFACAYNEAALAAYSLVEQCCPNGDFPRHLMLGALDGTPSFRNEFLPAPIRNVAQGDLERVRMLFLRLRAMINGLSFGAHPGAVAIWPSHTAGYALGRRALPYYFGRIAPDFWRPRPRCAVDVDWPWLRPPVPTGFHGDYAEASWLRIEGHVGKPHLVAATEILNERSARARNVEFCLLRTYFDDRSNDEAVLRAQIVSLLAKLIQLEHEARETFAGGVEGMVELANGRSGLNDQIEEASSAWLAVRNARELHCDWAALARDYLEARSELFCIAARLLGMLQRLRVEVDLADAKVLIGPGLDEMRFGAAYMLIDRVLGAILASPQRWDTADEIKKEADSLGDELERLRRALRFALETLQAQLRLMLEKNLPKSLADFDYEVFAARYREVVRGLLEFRLWTGVLGTVLTGRIASWGDIIEGRIMHAPLHEVEASSIEADLLALARSCLAARLATVFATYETLRKKDLSLYRNLSKIDGLEHLAGVAKGGSFILLCDTSADSGKVLADFSLERCLPCCCDLDPDSICLPPLALPDVRVVKLRARMISGNMSYFPKRLLIFVGANDYDLNGAGKTAPQVTIELLSATSERGAQLQADSNTATVAYSVDRPFPGVIDRFRYRLGIKGEECSGEAIGEVALVFAVDPLITGGIEGVASFTAAPTAGTAPLAVTFTDTSTGSITAWSWNFGDGSTSTARNPAHTYATAGTYTVSLVATGPGGTKTTTKSGYITVSSSNATVIIQVLDPREAPITNAAVTLTNNTGSFTRTNITDTSGDAVFRNVPAGDYSATANAQGFIAGAVGRTFPLGAGESLREAIRLAEIRISLPPITVGHTAGTLGVDVVEATVKVRQTLGDRHTQFVNVFNGATDDPGILTSDAYAKAAGFMASGLADPEKTEAEIAADYKETSTALATAAKQSTGEAKAAYQEMLSAVSMAYLDHVAASNPATLTPEAAAEVKTVTKALKSAGVSLTAVQTQWSGEALTNNLGVNTAAGIGTLLG